MRNVVVDARRQEQTWRDACKPGVPSLRGSGSDATFASNCHLDSFTSIIPQRTMTLELCTNVAAKIEPFLLLSKSAKGAAAAKLIENATSAPGVFNFSELLELPNIQEVRDDLHVATLHCLRKLAQLSKTNHSSQLELLRLFAYGTYEDYISESPHPSRPFVG